MKLQAEIEGGKFEVEVRTSDGTTYARVGDMEYELEVSEPEPGVFLLKRAGKIYEASVTPGDDASPTRVSIKGREFEIRYVDPKRLRGSTGSDDQADSRVEIRTAMPGKVVKVLVPAGESVEKGEGVVVVEAMKMQNELRSPRSGTVREVLVDEGSTVAAGEILAVIE